MFMKFELILKKIFFYTFNFDKLRKAVITTIIYNYIYLIFEFQIIFSHRSKNYLLIIH